MVVNKIFLELFFILVILNQTVCFKESLHSIWISCRFDPGANIIKKKDKSKPLSPQ
jgi:hypothetical protein